MAEKTGRSVYLSTLELHELDEACKPIAEGFDAHPYLVGSAGERSDYRDVDVRLILADEEFDALFKARPKLWALLSRALTTYLRSRTGLPVDFQIQRRTEANEKHSKPRNALGTRELERYAGGGDASPVWSWPKGTDGHDLSHLADDSKRD